MKEALQYWCNFLEYKSNVLVKITYHSGGPLIFSRPMISKNVNSQNIFQNFAANHFREASQYILKCVASALHYRFSIITLTETGIAISSTVHNSGHIINYDRSRRYDNFKCFSLRVTISNSVASHELQ